MVGSRGRAGEPEMGLEGLHGEGWSNGVVLESCERKREGERETSQYVRK